MPLAFVLNDEEVSLEGVSEDLLLVDLLRDWLGTHRHQARVRDGHVWYMLSAG